MDNTIFPYQDWVSDAMIAVLKLSLEKLSTAENIGDHHLYINFETTSQKAVIPKFLIAKYPKEMTIILQHQFSKLKIGDDGFEVHLSFSGKSHKLYIPFSSVTHFADPSVNFGMEVRRSPSDRETTNRDNISNNKSPDTSIEKTTVQQDNQASNIENKSSSAEVINIDAFRDH